MEHVFCPHPLLHPQWEVGEEGGSIFAEEKDGMLQILADRRKAGGFSPPALCLLALTDGVQEHRSPWGVTYWYTDRQLSLETVVKHNN